MKVYTLLNVSVIDVITTIIKEATPIIKAEAERIGSTPSMNYVTVSGIKAGEWFFGLKGTEDSWPSVVGFGSNLAEAIVDFAYSVDNLIEG